MTEDIKKYIEKMKKIQNNLLQYIEEEEQPEVIFSTFTILVDETKILDNSYEFKSFLYLLANISNNHHRNHNFIEKIEKIIQHYKNQIQKYYTNYDIFTIFKKNKRILLLLIEQKIISIDDQIVSEMLSEKLSEYDYFQYFSPEINSPQDKKEDEDFYNNRKIGQSANKLAKLIQEDNIKDFIIYVNKNSLKLDSEIKRSIYETNPFLLKRKKVTLIEYAAFFGSIQIFQYLNRGNVELKPPLWFYAIHGQNAEIIHFLEENKVNMIPIFLINVLKNQLNVIIMILQIIYKRINVIL